MLKSLNVMNFISLLLFPNVGLLSVLSLGLIIVVVYGKIVKDLSIILFKWFLLLSSVFYSSDPKQVLKHEWGGAFQTLRYAKKKKHISIINLRQTRVYIDKKE